MTTSTYSHPIVAKHQHQLEEIQRRVWRHQNRIHQLQVLEQRTRFFVDASYSESSAKGHLHGTLDYIFEDLSHGREIKAQFSVPERVAPLLTHKPCIFTFLPGIDSHDSLSQYDITLGDRTSKMMSRGEVDVTTRVTSNPASSMTSFIINAPMRSVVDPSFAELLVNAGMVVVYHRFKRPLSADDCDTKTPTVQSDEESRKERLDLAKRLGRKIFFGCGVSPEDIDVAKELLQAGALGVCVDVALANSYQAAAGVLELKSFIAAQGLSAQIMAGNVDNEEGYFLMAEAGADVIKVGIGPGSNCTTRGTTGAGKGQGSALMAVNRARFVYGPNAPEFIADGGIEDAVDVTRALALGATCGMSGKLFTKCRESGALKRTINGTLMAWSFGEASDWAQIYSRGGVKAGFAVEGKGAWIPVEYSFDEFISGMRAKWRNSFTYYNAASVNELRRKFSIEQQFCDLILGGETGIYKASGRIGEEAGTRMK
jgi:hypothetical protein